VLIGHEVRLSETNGHGWVPLCECGWIGDVAPMVGYDPKAPLRAKVRRELTQSIALDAHQRHMNQERADIARRSDAELARIGRAIPLANATLQRRGRWGNP
jgi:hypothetical protein